LLVLAAGTRPAKAASIPYLLSVFNVLNDNADGSVSTPDLGVTAILTGGNNGSGLAGTTDLVTTAGQDGVIEFQYMYSSLDAPGFDWAGYLVAGLFTQLADTDGESGSASFAVSAGDVFGFRVVTSDNTQEPGVFTISDFTTLGPSDDAVPEPGTLLLVSAAIAALTVARRHARNPREKGL